MSFAMLQCRRSQQNSVVRPEGCPELLLSPRPDPHRSNRWAGHWAFLWVALVQLAAQPLLAAPPVVAPPSQQEYWARFDRRDWDAAIASAEQLVAALRPATPATALSLSETLSLLGNAQLGKSNLVAAEAAFTESVSLAEQQAGSGSARLVDPLRGLGYTLAAQGKHAQALPYMDRALILSRRNSGLFDISQLGLLRQLTTSLTVLGQPIDAERHMLYLLRVGEHAYGADDPRMAQLHCTVGEWYAQLGQMDIARQHFRTALDVVERKLGRNDLATVKPLRALAESYPREVLLSQYRLVTRQERLASNVDGTGGDSEPLNPRFLSSEGERALVRAIKVLEGNVGPDALPDASRADTNGADANRKLAPDREGLRQTLIETLLQTGDWFLMKQQQAKAFPYYQHAAVLSGKENAGADSTNESALGFPRQIYYPTPSLATRNLQRPANEVEERFVQVEFTARQDGSTANERVTDQDATDRQISQTLEAIRAARYRPKFVDGKPVDTPMVSYRQVFRQRKEPE